jgi:hypothetical protein
VPAPGPQGATRVWSPVQADRQPDWNTWRAAANLDIPVTPADRVFSPERASPFLAAGRVGPDADLKVWNIVTNKEEGQIKDAQPGNQGGVLSPDGQHFATWGQDEFHVFSSRTGKKCNDLREDGTSPVWLDFPAASEATTVVRSPAGPDRVVHWDLRTGGRFRIELEDKAVGNGTTPAVLALSPNGRYLAYFTNRTLEVIELKGTLKNRLPALTGPQAVVDEVFGLAFSPDGQGLAAYVRSGAREHVVSYEFVEGRIVRSYSPRRMDPVTSFGGRRLEWLPNRSGWLFNGQLTLDVAGVQKKTSVLSLTPSEAQFALRRVVNDRQMLTVRLDRVRREARIGVMPAPSP